MRRAEQLHEEILAQMDLSKEASDEELLELIHRILEEKSKEEFIPLGEKAILGRELFNAFRKLDILQELIEDEEITEIMINGTQPIFIERNGRIYETDKKFLSKGKLEDVVQQMVAGCNRVVNEATPIVDARLEDGSRVNVVLPPVALNGPIVTIRKFPKSRITMETMIDTGSIGKEAAAMLIQAVKAKYNIFISGGTGSGKTTFLNVLSDFIPKEERIITIEDSAELQITGIPNLVRLEARNANVEGTGEINIRDLIRTALRMRPERIIVGEVRGEEALDMLCLVILIMLQTAMALKMARKNQLLEQKAYIDIHTGLPNKGSCEELLNNREILREPTACVIFDLNNLKTVNDTRGHSAGDQLILSFARLLRRVIPEKHFVGRYGGDEFMAVIYHTDRQEVEGILDSLRREADAANRDGNQLPLSYAYGWAISADYEGCIMQTLLDKADYCMYENKRAYYATHDRRAPRP